MIRQMGKVLASLGALVCLVGTTHINAATSDSTPVAYVYVANTPHPGASNYTPHQVIAFAADAEGRLTALPGSPFDHDIGPMAVNGLYLMGAKGNQQIINIYKIASDGHLDYMGETNYAEHNQGRCGAAGQIFFDHTGHTLYVQEYDIDCANSGTASYAADVETGTLAYLGQTNTGSEYNDTNPASFIANNIYAYAAGPGDCYIYETGAFERNNNGLLTELNTIGALTSPEPPSSFRRYVAYLAAADTTNHVAMTEMPANPPDCLGRPVQLATYTADSHGNLTTTSTYANMPTTAIVSPYDLRMAPSGVLLAVGGQEGLQVFHFNGANPVTPYTGLLTRDPINEMFWDNDNHLYAISQSANKLHVFTITNSQHTEAPGSPYTITSPDNIIVQPLPLPWTK